ncbi:hypothetical protein GcM1_234081 [Golovinomyces cichoracearum]|uniref:Uncharacterized protein n=1 Tax=Golovinomyces cichoracearum TaxID=62708 RepID=A0A420ILG5_9PEZI|nr:hypothetical protein GcM1_234081 [Golovinomyces cichoracearum]
MPELTERGIAELIEERLRTVIPGSSFREQERSSTIISIAFLKICISNNLNQTLAERSDVQSLSTERFQNRLNGKIA